MHRSVLRSLLFESYSSVLSRSTRPYLRPPVSSSYSAMSSTSPATKRPRTSAVSDTRCIDTIRVLSADIVEKANSGHPGAPMGCAPMAHLLWSEVMVYNAANPKWINRDRFVLSNGHACALLYSMLHLSGYNISVSDLQQFRQLGSITPGHPENFLTPGVEVSTGPLGQGICNAVGMAMGEAHLRATYAKDGFSPIDHFTYVICGDGCLQEGVSGEACSLAGHLGLGRLIVLYDDNHVTIDGDTALSFTEDVNKRYEAYGWHVQTVDDVNDLNALRHAIDAARAEVNRPSMIKVRTIIGQGSAKQGTGHVHGAPLGASDLANVKKHFGFDPAQSFVIPDEVREVYSARGLLQGGEAERAWNEHMAAYTAAHPQLAAELHRRFNNELPMQQLMDAMPKYSAQEAKAVATRNRSEEVLNAAASVLPEIFGGSADLTPSNLTALKGSGDFQHATPTGRYVRFGVREHAMAAICNGLFAHSGFRPFGATFFNFVGYMLGAVRLSALSRFGVIYVLTHDSIGLGEDGPTHQPIETLESVRSIPNLLTFRPADGNETVGSYLEALKHVHTPSILTFSRQACPTLPGSDASKVSKGGYTVHETSNASAALSLVLVSTGTEVSLTIQVADAIAAGSPDKKVRVVSMPCTELFDRQSLEYQLEVFPDGVPVMAIEPATSGFWLRYAHAAVGINTFGMSGPGGKLYDHFGFTTPKLVAKAHEVLDFYSARRADSKLIRPRFAEAGTLH